MISRRAFFGVAAGVSAAGVSGARPVEASICNPPPLGNVPVRRTGKVEIAFKSPGPQPNGLQATKDGLWIIDQSAGSKAYLVDYADGRVLRSFETDTVRPSGSARERFLVDQYVVEASVWSVGSHKSAVTVISQPPCGSREGGLSTAGRNSRLKQ